VRQVSGFPCPECGQAELADIISPGIIPFVELSCPECARVWTEKVT